MISASYGDAEKVTKSSQFSFINLLLLAKVDRVCQTVSCCSWYRRVHEDYTTFEKPSLLLIQLARCVALAPELVEVVCNVFWWRFNDDSLLVPLARIVCEVEGLVRKSKLDCTDNGFFEVMDCSLACFWWKEKSLIPLVPKETILGSGWSAKQGQGSSFSIWWTISLATAQEVNKTIRVSIKLDWKLFLRL